MLLFFNLCGSHLAVVFVGLIIIMWNYVAAEITELNSNLKALTVDKCSRQIKLEELKTHEALGLFDFIQSF